MSSKTRMITIGNFYRQTRDFLLDLFSILAIQNKEDDGKTKFIGWRQTPPNMRMEDLERIARELHKDVTQLKSMFTSAGLNDKGEENNDPPSIDLLNLYNQMVIRADLATGAMYIGWLRQICLGDFISDLPTPNKINMLDKTLHDIQLRPFYLIARHNDTINGDDSLTEHFADSIMNYFYLVTKHKQTIFGKNLRNLPNNNINLMDTISQVSTSLFPAVERFSEKLRNADTKNTSPEELLRDGFGEIIQAIPSLNDNEQIANQTINAVLADGRMNKIVNQMFPEKKKEEEILEIEGEK